jgi:hypothetical protein
MRWAATDAMGSNVGDVIARRPPTTLMRPIDVHRQISYARLTVKLSPQFDHSFGRFDGFPRKTDRT